VLSASLDYNFGARPKRAYSMFDGLIELISLAEHCLPARVCDARQIASAPLGGIRATRVSYPDRYIKGVAEAVAGGAGLEPLKQRSGGEARRELMRLATQARIPPTWRLSDPRAARTPYFWMSTFGRYCAIYFDGVAVSGEQLREFAQTRWGAYQGYVGCYITTNTEVWARRLGVTFRLTSAAFSDDEYHESVDDNAYTNGTASWNLGRLVASLQATPVQVRGWRCRSTAGSWPPANLGFYLFEGRPRTMVESGRRAFNDLGFQRAHQSEQFSTLAFRNLQMLERSAHVGQEGIPLGFRYTHAHVRGAHVATNVVSGAAGRLHDEVDKVLSELTCLVPAHVVEVGFQRWVIQESG
jgi:hypothetical protein